jgi:hypothetical protein
MALFCVLSFFYILTSRAHLIIADEETMYLVTESLVQRGTFAQLPEAEAGDAPRAVVRAKDGAIYAITGPLQSLMSIPLFLVGRGLARFFPPSFSGYLTRFFVLLFNGPVHAATVAVLYLWGRDVGYRCRTALFVALTFAMASVSWFYARTFFAETLLTFWLVLGTWALYRYVRIESWPLMACAGLSLGLGIATKYVAAVIGPAYALVLLLTYFKKRGSRNRLIWVKRTLAAGAIPFLLIVGLLFVFNYVRFGSIWQTGYTRPDTRGSISSWSATATPLVSWYGYLFSAGKGFFFFTPPALLALWGFPPLIQRRRRLAILLLAVIASYPLFYSLVTSAWHGGGNWGPRYIVCVTPFVLLAVGAFIENGRFGRLWRMGIATALFVVGFWVQLSALFVNFGTYLFSDVPAPNQRFYPQDSPLGAQWRLWPGQLRRWQAYDHRALAGLSDQDQVGFYTLEGDLYNIEVPEMTPYGRWTGKQVSFYVYARPEEALTFSLTYSRSRSAGESWEGLQVIYDGFECATTLERLAVTERDIQWQERGTIPADAVHVWPGHLMIRTPTWVPDEMGDPRALGIFLTEVQFFRDGERLSHRNIELPKPLPVSSAHPWSWQAMFWFYNPENARPADLWPWYVGTSGIPPRRAQRFIIAFAALSVIGLALSGVWFDRSLRRLLSQPD